MTDSDSDAYEGGPGKPPAVRPESPATNRSCEPAEIETFLAASTPEQQRVAATTVPESPTGSTHPPGPGLIESLGWTALVLVFQFAGTLAVLVALVAVVVITSGGRMPRPAPDFANLPPDLFAVVSGLPALLAYLVLIPLACWRLSPAPLRKLNFSAPSLTQLLIVCSCVLPLGFLSDALYTLVQPVWAWFLEQVGMGHLTEMGLAEMMSNLNGASLPLLLFFLSAVPAVGEEWILRGLIGRGLVARWGIVPGILLTSIFFAAMHLDPPHVAAVFPIGLIMHFVYLATRSFWMPILYHFLNNATVSVFTSLGGGNLEEAAEDKSTLWFALFSLPYLAVAMWVLWRLRTRYFAEDGSEPRPGYFSFEHLPESQARRRAPNHGAAGLIFGVLLTVQLAMLGRDVWLMQQQQGAPELELEPPPAVVATGWKSRD